MIEPLLYLAGGAAALYFGAEWLVRGGARAGRLLGVSGLVVGLTVVSLGTSAPELAVSLLSAAQGRSDLALGNVLGSNLANVGLILGVVALIHPVRVGRIAIARDLPLMIGLTALVYPLAVDLLVGRWDGAVLLAVLAGYLFLLAHASRRPRPPRERSAPRPEAKAEAPEEAAVEAGGAVVEPAVAAEIEVDPGGDAGERRKVLLKSALLAGAGSVALVLGGQGIVIGAVAVAERLGVPELIVGLSVVAIGTSLPELAASLVAALRGNPGMAVGNVVGSNVFNLTAVLGTTAVIRPVTVSPLVPHRELLVVFVLSALILPVAWMGRRIGRWGGLLFLAVYVAAWGWFVSG